MPQSNDKPRVLLFHCERYALSKLREQDDLHIILVVKSESSKERVEEDDFDEIHIVNYRDSQSLIELARKIHAEAPLSAVLAVRDESAPPAARVARELGVAGVDLDAALAVDSKARMRELLNARAISPTAFQLLEERPDDASSVIDQVGLPLLCKPHDGSGSEGIRKCCSREAFEAHLEEYSFERPLIVEEFLEGPEYSVEAFSRNGVHRVIAITEKFTTGAPNFVELGHIIPADIPHEELPGVVDLVERVLDAIGHEVGASHTEIKLTPCGPRVVESHVRQGGDGIEQLINEAYDFVMTVETIKALTGRPNKEPLPLTAPRTYASAQFFRFVCGTVKSVEGLDEMSAKEGVKILNFPYDCGSVLREVRSSHTRHGYFGCVAESREALDRLITEVRQGFRVVVEG